MEPVCVGVDGFWRGHRLWVAHDQNEPDRQENLLISNGVFAKENPNWAGDLVEPEISDVLLGFRQTLIKIISDVAAMCSVVLVVFLINTFITGIDFGFLQYGVIFLAILLLLYLARECNTLA